jgi:EAL domain-containing protein (putative c-di-GMP-specific phosphodiesterase class I)
MSLQRIRDRGVRIALDNFSSGYDIMTRLQGLPVDQVKRDTTETGAGVDAARTEAMCQAGDLYGPPLRLQRVARAKSNTPA